MSLTDFFHGVTVTDVDIGPRVISVPSSSIIGLVDTFDPENAPAKPNYPTLVTSEREAAKQFGTASRITQAVKGMTTQAGAVIVAVGIPETSDPAELTSAVIGGVTVSGARTGMQALLDGKSIHNAQPRLIVCPGHSRTQAVATQMDSLAAKLRAIALVDGPDGDDEAAIAYFKDFGSKRIYGIDPSVKVWDTTSNEETLVPASAYAAGLFAQTDQKYGFWASPSNKELTGVIGTGRPVEFLDGDPSCRANLLNAANISTIIRDGGYRLWGNRTCSADPKWAFVTRVRTLDIVMDAILYGHKWAVDRSITKTYVKDVTEGLSAFMRDLKHLGAVVNFEVFPDPELNSASQLEQGRVYWNIRFTDVPPAENPIFRVEVTNDWITEVLDFN
ncbi:MAG: phage tail sheath family protein [Betaproteobacteria bacterium]|nr:phage tail sheath family protein [Betaproteobacteria bacterium]